MATERAAPDGAPVRAPRAAAEAALALAVTAAVLVLQVVRHLDTLRGYRVPRLPAFDAYVYVAMADHPRVFTVAPWGHRILTPWIAHALPFGDLTVAFRVVTLGSFTLASLLLFEFLRRLGHRPWAAALGSAAFLLSPPVGELIAAPFLVEPLACALLIALLLALEMDLGVAALALLAVLGVMAKEIVLLFLPLVYFARWAGGRGGAARDAVLVIAAAVAAALLLRMVWTPHLRTPLPDLGADRLRLIAGSLLGEPGRWLAVAALGGLTPIAVAGALRVGSRPYLGRYGWIVAATLAQPLLAHYAIQQVVGELNRYLLYVVPFLVPLALLALDRVIPNAGPGAPRRSWAPSARRIAGVGAVLAVLAPLVLVDRYRRLDLQGRRDGLYILGFCHGTLNTARKLRDGAAVLLRMDERRFAARGFETELFARMRWFLRDGWGSAPHYGTDEVLMQADRATLVLPSFTPGTIELTLAMSARVDTPLGASVNGRPLGQAVVGVDRTRVRFVVPPEALFRGDNLLTLDARDAPAALLRLYAVTYSPLVPARE